jgi:hypothetical protein
MALETPNAIIAAAICYVDTRNAPDIVSIRSSNGIVGFSQFEQDATNHFAAFELENPCTNDEGVVLSSFLGSGGTPAIFDAGVTPQPQSGQYPPPTAAWIASRPPNQVLLGLGTNSALPFYLRRFSFAVLRLITTIEPIAGEPLP